MGPVIPGFVEFEFDLPDALLTSIEAVFDRLDSAPLLPSNVEGIPEAQGVYMLLLRDDIVYIGKTDAEAGLKNRLSRHAWTIQHRLNLNPNEVTFKAVRVFVFTAMDLETQLIRHYRERKSVSWNFSGFGSNDPGRQRDTTNVKPEGFDISYPIDIDRELDIDIGGNPTAAELLRAMKEVLPYTLRFERAARGGRQPHPDLTAARVMLPSRPFTTRALIVAAVRALAPGWQATALPSRVIIYRESRQYEYGTIIEAT